MAKFVLLSPSITINAVDLSNKISQVEISMEKDEVDVTGFQAAAREILPGIGDATVSVTFFQDFGAGAVDATLFPLFSSGSLFPIVIKPGTAAVSATNPSYSGTFCLLQYTPLSGAMGDASTMDVDFRNATQAGIVRGTA